MNPSGRSPSSQRAATATEPSADDWGTALPRVGPAARTGSSGSGWGFVIEDAGLLIAERQLETPRLQRVQPGQGHHAASACASACARSARPMPRPRQAPLIHSASTNGHCQANKPFCPRHKPVARVRPSAGGQSTASAAPSACGTRGSVAECTRLRRLRGVEADAELRLAPTLATRFMP